MPDIWAGDLGGQEGSNFPVSPQATQGISPFLSDAIAHSRDQQYLLCSQGVHTCLVKGSYFQGLFFPNILTDSGLAQLRVINQELRTKCGGGRGSGWPRNLTLGL